MVFLRAFFIAVIKNWSNTFKPFTKDFSKYGTPSVNILALNYAYNGISS
jgi:hypothetical protein